MDSQALRQTQLILAAQIKALRQEAGLSQEALAHEADIDRTYVSQLERALVNPSLSVIVRVADALGVTVLQLLKPM
jgi:transcriptional regulator with XRE-family HTH domain